MKFYTHPLRDGVTLIVEKHFAPEIASRFKYVFEAQMFQTENIVKQLQDDKVAMEVYYQTGKDTTEYVCDIWSWMTPKQAEVYLLRMVTDKVRSGAFGKDWIEGKDGRISEDVASGKFETREEVSDK